MFHIFLYWFQPLSVQNLLAGASLPTYTRSWFVKNKFENLFLVGCWNLNGLFLETLQLTVIDMLVYIVWINVAPDTNPVRWSRPLRVLFIINFSDGKQVFLSFDTDWTVLSCFYLWHTFCLYVLYGLVCWSVVVSQRWHYVDLYQADFVDCHSFNFWGNMTA